MMKISFIKNLLIALCSSVLPPNPTRDGLLYVFISIYISAFSESRLRTMKSYTQILNQDMVTRSKPPKLHSPNSILFILQTTVSKVICFSHGDFSASGAFTSGGEKKNLKQKHNDLYANRLNFEMIHWHSWSILVAK